jgi:hypothetical protein
MAAAASILGCATTAPNYAPKTDIVPHEGFRDISWRAPLEDFPDMIPTKSQLPGRWKRFTREPEKLSIGDIDVDQITYIFIDQRFAGVNIKYSGMERFKRLMVDLGDHLGRPSVVNKQMKMLSWEKDGAAILLRFYQKPNFGELKYMLTSAING